MPADTTPPTHTAAADAPTAGADAASAGANATAAAAAAAAGTVAEKELTSFDAFGVLVVGALGTYLFIHALIAAKMLVDALLELQRHYKRAQTEYVRPPSRKSAGRGKGGAAAAAGSGAAAAAAGGNALRPGWWKGARKIRSKALTWRILYCAVGWTLLLHRSVVVDPLLAALPEEGMALFLIVIVVPVVGVAAHQNLNLFQMPSMMEPPPGMEQTDYWVDE